MSRFKLLKGSRIVATADTLPEAEEYAKKHGCRVMQDAARANPSSGAKQRQRGTREDAGEGAGASLGWAAHYRQAAKRYKADPTEGDAAAAIEHHRQELEAVRQRYPSSRLPGSRANPSKRDPDHDPKFWAGEWIGEIVNQIRDKASNVYYDEDFSSLEFDGRACSLGYDDKGAILVTKLSFDADDNMKEKRLKFGPSKSVEDGEKIVTKAVAAILARDNPSQDSHREFSRADLSRAKQDNDSAKAALTDKWRYIYGMSALREANLAAREAEHAGDQSLMRSSEDAQSIARSRLDQMILDRIDPPAAEYRRNPGRGPDVSRHSAALAADVVAQCFSGHCDAQDAVDAALVRHGVELPYRSNSTIEVRRNGHHPAEKWAKGDRKPAIDFGEMGQDRQALAKWLQAHPGKTAAFKAAGTVYHSAQFDGQVFTVPASRRNGRGARIDHDVTNIYPNREKAEADAKALQDADSEGWKYVVHNRQDGKFSIAIHDEDGQHIANWGMRRNGAVAAPDPANFAEYQRLFSATLAAQDDKRKRLRGDLHAMSIEGPTAAEKALERFIERIGPDEWDRVTQQALRAYQ